MSTLETLLPANARALEAPVRQVTLLEDRAQVRRAGALRLSQGQHRVVVKDVAPVLQDLSLRATVTGPAAVVDARVVRTMRVRKEEQPERVRALERDLEALTEKLRRLSEDRALLEQKRLRVEQVLDRGLAELPEDVAWGLAGAQWKDTLEGLFEKARSLRAEVASLGRALVDGEAERDRLVAQRRAFDAPDATLVAWLEADVVVTGEGEAEVEVSFEYTVPNALWRPLHSARLAEGRLDFESRAAVWQNTGEDWDAVRLVFSTARASLGIEAPLLGDDLLTAQKKSDQVVVQAREVVIQKAKVDGAAPRPATGPQTVELPGVDDGGEIRTLEARGPCTVPSDGRMSSVPLFSFTATPTTSLVAFPELELRAFLKSLQRNESRFPILAGPVELLLEHGYVGWTRALFVAPGEQFALSFGPDEALRLSRVDRERVQEARDEAWRTKTTSVSVYLSNLSDAPRTVEVTERLPVSELAQVKVELALKRTNPKPKVDEHGFATWLVELAPRAQAQLTLSYDVSAAPGVQGLP